MRKAILLFLLIFSFIFASSEVVNFPNSLGKNNLFNVVSATDGGVELIFSVHQMVTDEIESDGAVMKTYGVPGMFLPNDEGAPSLQGTGRYIAIPQGATAKAIISEARTETYHNIDVLPAAKIPLDTDNSPTRYVKDMNIYGKNEFYPLSPVRLSEPMQIRGVDCVICGVTPFQYNPITKDLIVYKDIRIRIEFEGGNGHFGDDALRNPYWEPMLQGHLLNYNSLPEFDYARYYAKLSEPNRDGVEYIIITPDDPIFVAWGDTIKNWRKLQGITSDVYTLTEIGGSTATAIENFLNSAYNTWSPRPVGFLILSDYATSGDKAYGVTSPMWSSYCVSDNKYADVGGDDLPDMYHGRICAQNESQLSIMVKKFLNYERTPPTSTNFYYHPLVACAWSSQSGDARWFQICGEVIRGFFINGLGKNPERQYAIYNGTPVVGGAWSSATNTSTVVNYFYNRGWLPSLTNPYDANWWSNGTSTGITNAINSGAFLVQHRDHGYEEGWGEPAYSNSDINNLTNDNLTFVNSHNCLTGKYNNSTEVFAEKFHRYNISGVPKGAVGVNTPSEVSYSFVNDTYGWGMYDCMWQQFMNDYPATDMISTSVLMPCFAMNYAKYFLQSSSWPYNTGSKTVTYHLFHHHGDVFQPLYSEVPQNLTVSHASVLSSTATSFTVTANDSSVIALTVSNEIIGVARGTGNPVSIPIAPQASGSTMKVTVTKQNFYRYQASVPITSSKDVGVTEIVQPVGLIDSTGAIIPRAKVKNFGADSTTFNVTFKIGGIYTSTRSKKLNTNTEDTVNFAGWSSPRGTYTVRCSTYVSGDVTPTNDTMSRSVTVIVKDAGVTAITTPPDTIYRGNLSPKATVKNFGSQRDSFYSFFKIYDLSGTQVYLDSSYVALNINSSSTRTFKTFWFEAGTYSLRCSTALNIDDNPFNNVKFDSVVVNFIPPWSMKDTVPFGPNDKTVKSGGALALGVSGNIYALKGNNTREFYVYNAGSDLWTTKDTLPYAMLLGRVQRKKVNKGGALAYNDDASPDMLYATKGNNTLEFWAYDVSADTWYRKQDVPFLTVPIKKVKGGAGLAYINRSSTQYVFLLKGNKTLEFYAFHCQGDSWRKSFATAPHGPNTKAFGDGSCLVADDGNNIVYALKGGAKYNEFYRYSVSLNNWLELESLPQRDQQLNKKVKIKDGAAMCYDGDSLIYAFKGGNSQSFWIYNINQNKWTEKDTIPRAGSSKKVYGGGALVYYNDKVYALKGNRTNEFWCYEPQYSVYNNSVTNSTTNIAQQTETPTPIRKSQFSIEPNPLKLDSKILLNLSQDSRVKIRMYNGIGQVVTTITDQEYQSGNYSLPINSDNLKSGIYFLKTEINNNIYTNKIIIQ